MWVAAAAFGANFVHLAGIVVVKKRAGALVGHPVALGIAHKVCPLKIGHLHPKVRSNAGNIGFRKNGVGRFAAVAASQAIYFCKYRLVHFL